MKIGAFYLWQDILLICKLWEYYMNI
jgi:hypothetical protein